MRKAHGDNIKTFTQYHKPGSTLPLPPPIGWGLEGPPSLPTLTPRRMGGLHLKVAGYLKEKSFRYRRRYFTSMMFRYADPKGCAPIISQDAGTPEDKANKTMARQIEVYTSSWYHQGCPLASLTRSREHEESEFSTAPRVNS